MPVQQETPPVVMAQPVVHPRDAAASRSGRASTAHVPMATAPSAVMAKVTSWCLMVGLIACHCAGSGSAPALPKDFVSVSCFKVLMN